MSRVEGGQHINPTWNTLSRYAAALGKAAALALRDLPVPEMRADKGAAANGAAWHAKKSGRRREKTARR